VGVIDISDDDSVDGFAVGGDSAGKVIHLKSDGIGIVDWASKAPLAWPFWKDARKP